MDYFFSRVSNPVKLRNIDSFFFLIFDFWALVHTFCCNLHLAGRFCTLGELQVKIHEAWESQFLGLCCMHSQNLS